MSSVSLMDSNHCKVECSQAEASSVGLPLHGVVFPFVVVPYRLNELRTVSSLFVPNEADKLANLFPARFDWTNVPVPIARRRSVDVVSLLAAVAISSSGYVTGSLRQVLKSGQVLQLLDGKNIKVSGNATDDVPLPPILLRLGLGRKVKKVPEADGWLLE